MAFVDLLNVMNWTISTSGDIHVLGHSDSSGHKTRVSGQDDWSAVVTLAATGDVLAIVQGTAYTFHFDEDGSHQWTGQGMVESIETTIPVDDGGIITKTINIGGDGALTETGGSGTAPFSSKNGDVEWEALP